MPERLHQKINFYREGVLQKITILHSLTTNSLSLDKSWNDAAIERVICLNGKTLPKIFKKNNKKTIYSYLSI